MLVNKAFYQVAGPLLYQELRFPETRPQRVLMGIDVLERASRSRPPKTNLKKDLLAQTRVLQVSWHEGSLTCVTVSLPKLKTVRFLFAMWCNCAHSIHCEICSGESLGGYPCDLLSSIRAQKVVLTSLRAYNSHAVFGRLDEILSEATTVTIILSPDSHSIDNKAAQNICTLMKDLARTRSEMHLRLIVAPWSQAIKRVAGDSDNGISFRLTYRSARCIETSDAVDFISETISKQYQTTIYLIQAGGPAFDDYGLWDGVLYGLDPIAVQEGIESRLKQDVADWPKFTIKTRADYLAEGITDEIDEEELDRWRAAEKKEREDRALASFRDSILEECRTWRKYAHEASEGLESSIVVLEWLGEWRTRQEELTKRESFLLHKLCMEWELEEEASVEHGVETWEEKDDQSRRE